MVTLIIKGKLDGLNQYTLACRKNKFAGATLKKKNEKLVTGTILEQLGGVTFEGPVELNLRWYEQNKRRDPDNICFAKKFILDALVRNGIIQTDNWDGVKRFVDDFYIDKENPRIEVDIKGVDEDWIKQEN